MDLPAVHSPLVPGPAGAFGVSSADTLLASVLAECWWGGRLPHSTVAILCLDASFWRHAHNLPTCFYWANTFLFISSKCTYSSRYSPQENRDLLVGAIFLLRKLWTLCVHGATSRAISWLVFGLAWDKLAALGEATLMRMSFYIYSFQTLLYLLFHLILIAVPGGWG